MNLDPSLHRTLLAGTSRAPFAPGAGAAAELAPMLAGIAPEAALWHTLAAADLWQRAGRKPTSAAPIEACAPEPTCPRAAEQVLHLILRDIHPELLDTWLALAAQMGFVLPHACLAALIDKSVNHYALRPLLRPVLGKRGLWLAAQNPVWSPFYCNAAAPDEASASHWELGNLQQRCDALKAMRARGPVAALAAVEREWPQEPAENRIALLPCLTVGLSLHDEAFLERALVDKRKEVRQGAQQLLTTLPDSALVERCKARLAPLLTLKKKTGLGAQLGAMPGSGAPQVQLEIALPEACDKPMQRDGIGLQQYHGIGEKAGWLQDLMARVPPTHWSGGWQLTPSQVLTVLVESEYKSALVTGLAEAACLALRHQPDDDAIDWFLTLLREADAVRTGLHLAHMLTPHLALLPQEKQEQVASSWLDLAEVQGGAFDHFLGWAQQRNEALSPALSRRLLARIQADLANPAKQAYALRGNLKIAARVLDAALLDEVRAGWPRPDWEHWPQWRDPVDELLETLQFRHTLQRSFLEKSA